MKSSNISMLSDFNNFGSISYANGHMNVDVSSNVVHQCTYLIARYQSLVKSNWYIDVNMMITVHQICHIQVSLDISFCGPLYSSSALYMPYIRDLQRHPSVWSSYITSSGNWMPFQVTTSHCSMSIHFRNLCYIGQIKGCSAQMCVHHVNGPTTTNSNEWMNWSHSVSVITINVGQYRCPNVWWMSQISICITIVFPNSNSTNHILWYTPSCLGILPFNSVSWKSTKNPSIHDWQNWCQTLPVIIIIVWIGTTVH